MSSESKVGGFAELLDALFDYFGPMDDPSIGWIGNKPSHSDIFKCEKCGQEHFDSEQIEHTPYCKAARLRKAMMAAFAESERLK